MAIGTTARPNTKIRLTSRGRVALTVLVVLVGLIVGMATAEVGLPGWSL